MTSWKHDDLAKDLASYLLNDRRMIWTDMQLGPSGSPRPDVYSIEKSYSKPNPTAYEIKVSRSDFQSDVTSGKYQSYFKFSGAVYFAVPDGLIKKTEIPDHCGLIVRKNQVWRVMKRAIISKVDIPASAYMKLLIDGVDRVERPFRPSPREASAWSLARGDRLQLGQDVAKTVGNLQYARSEVQRLEAEHKETRSKINTIKQEALDAAKSQVVKEREELDRILSTIWCALGLTGKPSIGLLRYQAKDKAHRISKDAEVCELHRQIKNIRQALTQAEESPVLKLAQEGSE